MDKLVISIVSAVAVALTSKLMYVIFLSGRRLSANSHVSRFFRHLAAAVDNFVSDWLRQNRKYRFAAYPCMLLGIGLTSLGIYWLAPLMDETGSFWTRTKYVAILIFAGIMFSLFLSLGSLLSLYLLGAYISVTTKRRKNGGEARGNEPTPEGETPNATKPVDVDGTATNDSVSKGAMPDVSLLDNNRREGLP